MYIPFKKGYKVIAFYLKYIRQDMAFGLIILIEVQHMPLKAMLDCEYEVIGFAGGLHYGIYTQYSNAVYNNPFIWVVAVHVMFV